MKIVVGLSLRNLKPRVWDQSSPYYLSQVQAVMVSYADFDLSKSSRRRAMEIGLKTFLGVPENVRVYLDNGSFAFRRKGKEVPREDYVAFVEAAKPDWYPPPQDYIPSPMMSSHKQAWQRRKTMAENIAFNYDGYVPVLHVGKYLDRYITDLRRDDKSWIKKDVALGAIVPNLLRAPKALPYREVLDALYTARLELGGKKVHLFGVGGTATLHLAALLGMDSVDSSGWRNRAARGIIQLPGRGDRVVADLGSWKGRKPSEQEWEILQECECPACRHFGVEGLKEIGVTGFSNRATHNLWTLLQEAESISFHLAQGLESYEKWYKEHVENSVYEPLIEYALELRKKLKGKLPKEGC